MVCVRGVAVISGLHASRPAPEEAAEVRSQGAVPATPEDDGSVAFTAPLKLWPACTAEDMGIDGSSEGLAAAVAAAAPVKPLELMLSVQPSSMPASLTVMYQGEVSNGSCMGPADQVQILLSVYVTRGGVRCKLVM
jgi:hypothetical protein